MQTLVTCSLIQYFLDPFSTYTSIHYLGSILQAKLKTVLFIYRGLFWTSDEQESHRFSIQYHEQPNVLGINNELLGILIKVKVCVTKLDIIAIISKQLN